MKKHNLLKVVLISIVVALLMTWVFTTTSIQYDTYGQIQVYEGTYQQLGLLDLFTYPSLTIYYFSTLFIFVIATGAFYGVLSKTNAYRNLLDKIVRGFKGKEWLFLSLTIILIAGITSLTGLNYAMLFVFPMAISIILLMGYNKLVAASCTAGSLLVGIMGTTYGYENVASLLDTLGVSISTEMTTKVIILVIGLILLIFHVLYYGGKTRNTVDLVEDYVPKATEKKRSVWPLAIIFDVTLIVMGLAFVPWESAFGITVFNDIATWVQEYTLFNFPILSKLLGTILPYGQWTTLTTTPFFSLAAVVLIGTGLIGLCYRIKWDEFLDGFLGGMKKALGPAALMTFIYTVLLIMTFHPVQLTIYKAILGLSNGFNIVTIGIVSVLSSLFNVDMLYAAQSTVPYLMTIFTDATYYPLMAILFQSLYGVTMLIAPTSVILMGTLAYLKVPYGEWLKHIWKLFVALFVLLFIIFTIVLVM